MVELTRSASPVAAHPAPVAWGRRLLRRADAHWLLVLPALVMMVALYLYPVAQVLWISVTEPKPGLDNYAALFTSASIHRVLSTTARICLITTAATLAIGYVVAYALVHAGPVTKRWLFFGVVLPLWTSALIRAFAWVTLLRREGVVNSVLLEIGAIESPLSMLWNEAAICIGMTHYLLPYAILPLYANMRDIDQRVVAAARGLGASRLQALIRVFLPLSLPGIVGAGVLVFIISLGFFITPAILGGGRTLMVAEYISDLIMDRLLWGPGTMLASFLVIFVAFLLWLLGRVVDLRKLFGAGPMSASGESYGNEVGTARWGAWMAVCFLLLPITIVIPVAFTDRNYLSLPEDGLSIRHFGNLFTSDLWFHAVGQSLVIGAASSVIAVVAGTLCAIGCWRIGSRLASFVRALMLVPIVVPTIVYALGLYRLFVDLELLDTYLGVILAHGVTGIPYVVVVVSTALAGFDARIDQAARSLGASMGQSLRWIILPNITPAIASGAILAFIHSWDELVVVLFIASRSIATLPRRIWDGINESLDPTMAAVATVLILLTTILLFLNLRVQGERR